MRILVTGKSGQVAQALAYVNREGGNRDHDLVFLGRPQIDLEQPAAIRAPVLAARPDIILSCAAHTHVDRCESEGDRAFAVNGVAPGVLGQAAAELDIPIIHLSTDYVFDGQVLDGQLRRPYREGDAVAPINLYGRSKLAGEVAVAAATPRHAIVRVSWVYSQFSDNFLALMLRLAASRSEISVVDDQVSCPTPAIELAQALLSLAEQMSVKQQYGVFHLSGADAVDRASLAGAVMDWARANGHPAADIMPVPGSTFPTPAQRPHYSALDCQKIATAYGIRLPSWHNWLGPCLDALVAKNQEAAAGR